MIHKIPRTCTGACCPAYEVEIPDDTPESEGTRVAVVAAVQSGANLDGANLAGAYLARALKLIGERPILLLGPLGSRSSYLTAYRTDAGVRLCTGCFFGDVPAFLSRVAMDHGDRPHGVAYRAAADLVRAVLGEDVTPAALPAPRVEAAS